MANQEQGDTIVEVLLATAVLTFSLVGALYAMSSGLNITLAAVERTQAQALVNSQVSVVQYARDQAVEAEAAGASAATYSDGSRLWTEMVAEASSSAPDIEPCEAPSAEAFYFDDVDALSLAGMNSADAVAPAVPEPGSGLWIEAYRSDAAEAIPYIDFYVLACWEPIGGGINSSAQTVLRQYVP